MCTRGRIWVCWDAASSPVERPAPGASILLTRSSWVNGFTDSEKVERPGWQVTDLWGVGQGFAGFVSRILEGVGRGYWMWKVRVMAAWICCGGGSFCVGDEVVEPLGWSFR